MPGCLRCALALPGADLGAEVSSKPSGQRLPGPNHLQSSLVTPARISELLRPFLETTLAPVQLDQISTYIDLLLRWNTRINLTAVRNPEEIVTRHFGESLFAARHLFPYGADTPVPEVPSYSPAVVASCHPSCHSDTRAQRAKEESIAPLHGGPSGSANSRARLLDIGSGAGFPGLPIKIWSPPTPVTLIESQHKKVAFLRELIRVLTLTDIDVFPGRAEHFPEASAAVVTLRAVERFDQILLTAATRLVPAGTLALLIGRSQVDRARQLLPRFTWQPPLPIPASSARLVLLGYSIF